MRQHERGGGSQGEDDQHEPKADAAELRVSIAQETGPHALSRCPRFVIAVAGLGLAGTGSALAQPSSMTFFMTSAGPGNGANLGGLAGADAHCQKLAASAGAGSRTWRAYLSTQPAR